MNIDKSVSSLKVPAQTKRNQSRWNARLVGGITRDICATYNDDCGINHSDDRNMPQREEIIRILGYLLEILFPGYTGLHSVDRAGLTYSIGNQLNHVFRHLNEQLERALKYKCRMSSCDTGDCHRISNEVVIRLLENIPVVREKLKTDIQAAMDGDPAAKSLDEIIIAYPGLRAIAIHRIAHVLYLSGIPLIPRVMSEYAHGTTGIDIHPGATIGNRFFIDHGTGVVIGETAILGNNVRLYQGVTLGALSFPKDADGNIIRGAKRHPNIEDNVTIFAGATILGNITIGHDSVIGGNVWLTESIPPCTKVTIAPPELTIRTRTATM